MAVQTRSNIRGKRTESPTPPQPREYRNIKQPLLLRGPRGALFVHIASFVIPRGAMPRKVMSRRMTQLGTVEGRA